MVRRSVKRSCQRMLRGAAVTCASAAVTLAAGCSREPSLNILGSFFPAWILCGVIGILLTILVRLAFVRLNFERELWLPLVVYPCLAACLTFITWLIFFS
jgi:hypothetical protein